MAQLLAPSFVTALDANGTPISGATLTFYVTGTTTPASVYSSAALSTPLANPLTADSAGRFAAVYLDPAVTYRAILKDASGSTIKDVDPVTNVTATDLSFTQTGTGAAARTVLSKLREKVSVLDFGADDTGVADCSDAVREAIDSLPSGGGTVFFPKGIYKFTSTVILPIKDYGLVLEGDRAQIVGNGKTGITIFETGKTTTSVDGVTNWGEPDETYLHRAIVIKGFAFRACNIGIKLFNAIWMSKIEDNWFDDFTTAIHLKRCFYGKVLNNHARPNDAARASSTPIFKFEEANNVMWIEGNSTGGIVGSVTKTGVGMLFSGGVAGLTIANNSIEGCVTGLSITGEVTGAAIMGNYFEANTSAVDLSSGGKSGLDIDANWFAYNTTDIGSAAGWVTGTFGESNYFLSTPVVSLGGATNSMAVQLPAYGYSESQHTTAPLVPSGWTLPAAAELVAPRYIYDSGTGIAAQRYRTAPVTTKDGMTPRYYTGAPGRPYNNLIPFCTITNNAAAGVGTVVIDTQIDYDSLCLPVRFALRIDDSVTGYWMVGIVYGGTNVIEQTSSGKTITASNNGGKLRITCGNFNTTNFIGGAVYIEA